MTAVLLEKLMKVFNSLTYGSLIILGAKDLVKAFSCRFLEPWGNMAMSVQSYCYVGVA